MKSKVDKLDDDKLVPVLVHLSKLSDVVKNDVVKKGVCNAKIKNIEDKISDITNLATNTTLNAKINELKNKIPNITKYLLLLLLLLLKTKYQMFVIYSKTTDYNSKISQIENKIAANHDYD